MLAQDETPSPSNPDHLRHFLDAPLAAEYVKHVRHMRHMRHMRHAHEIDMGILIIIVVCGNCAGTKRLKIYFQNFAKLNPFNFRNRNNISISC